MTFKIDEISRITLSWQDPFHSLDNLKVVKVFLGLFIIVILVIGTVFNSLLISFEKFGQDPRKRGLLNQIISQLHALIIFGYWSFLPVLFWRIVFGPIGSSSLLSMSLFNLNVFSYCTLFGISECYIYKFITIMIIKRMAPIIDDFFARFLFLWKVLAASLANVVHIHTIAHAQSMTSFLGMPNDTLLYNPLLKIHVTPVLLYYFLTVLAVSGISIQMTKRNLQINSDEGVQQPNLNVTNRNKDVVATGMSFVLGFVVAVTTIMTILANRIQDDHFQVVAYLVFDFSHSSWGLVIVPLIVYYCNQDFKSYCHKLLK